MGHAPKPGSRRDTRPFLRKAYDMVERSVASRIEPRVQGPTVATGLALLKKVDTRVRRTVEHRTTGLLHRLNIPAASDIRRLHEHLNAVEAHLTEVVRERTDDPAPRPTRKPRSR